MMLNPVSNTETTAMGRRRGILASDPRSRRSCASLGGQLAVGAGPRSGRASAGVLSLLWGGFGQPLPCGNQREEIHQMPKLYEYFGLTILFYSNDHEPIHVHGKYQGAEGKAEIITDDGEIIEIRYSDVKGRRPLTPTELKRFKECVERHDQEIVQKWIDYFVYHRPIRPVKISRRL